MAIKYLGVKRVQGTEAERTATSIPSGTNMGWKFLGRSTRVSGDKLQVASLGNYPYYMILADVTTPDANNVAPRFTINDDTSGTAGTNGKYSERHSYNGGTDTADKTYETDSAVLTQTLNGTGKQGFMVNYLANKLNQEKLNICETVDTDTGTGSGNTPNRRSKVWKWADNAVVTSIELLNGGSATANGDFGTNDEVVVLGYDPTATNSENFWEELASVELTGTASEISSGTITAKKWLWVQFYHPEPSGAVYSSLEFNGVTSGYASRRGNNYYAGSGDSTYTGESKIRLTESRNYSQFNNMFILNGTNEKLMYGHGIQVGDGTGAGNAPQTHIYAGKWANSARVTSMRFYPHTGTYPSGTILKVWGAD